MDIFEMAMQLIAGAGDSRSYSMEAISNAREGNFTEARACIEKAKEGMVRTHEVQTELIRGEMLGTKTEITLLMVHAQDHLTAAMLMRDMAEEFIHLYKTMKEGAV